MISQVGSMTKAFAPREGHIMSEVVGRTIQHGNQLWKVTNGDWYVQTFGWHPTGANPRYSWLFVSQHKVPTDVKEAT